LIEAMMFYALGFLSAGLVALIVGPPLWRRAVRLNHRAIEQTLPMTHAEIQAEKDHIRAAFAVSVRRLDSQIQKLEAQRADHLIEINRKREIITHLTAEGSMSAEDMIALEQQRNQLLQTVTARDAALAKIEATLAVAQGRQAGIESELAEAKSRAEAMVAERETQRMEIIARDTELDNLRDSVAAVKTTSTVGEVAMAGLETGLSEMRASLAIERRKAEESAEAAAAIEVRRIEAMAELVGVREELSSARNKIDELSLRLVEAEAAGMGALAIQEDKAEMEAQLSHLETVNQKLEAELAATREAGRTAAGDADRDMLRGKLLEIGTAVAKLAASGSGPSLVPALPGPDRPAAESGAINLAERIRALQHAETGT
jgi:chromosome segregation ATPase